MTTIAKKKKLEKHKTDIITKKKRRIKGKLGHDIQNDLCMP